MFELTSANIDDGDKPKAYECDIIYGSINEFEGDVLSDEFLNENTRNRRPYDIVIIDEADSMMVDGKTHMTRLSSQAPGMSNLLPILVVIWVEMKKNSNQSKEDLFETIVPMITCEKLKRTKPMKTCDQTNKHSKIQIPNHLYDFVIKNRLEVWIKSAYSAEHKFTQDREYLVRDGQIKVVDFTNTGIVHKNMKWTDGLQQFLQLKHDVPLTAEELTTNYLANSTFFQKYIEIFGVTGTLGCDLTKQFLNKTYKLDSIVIPTFKTKQHLSLTPIIEKTKAKWYKSIVQSCVPIVKNGRTCLIIAESIAESNKIKEIMEMDPLNFPQEKIVMYQTESDSSKIKREFGPREVIVTTNIAGRGVDIGLYSKFCFILKIFNA
jgi:preprotein translocase subunit SecA